MAHLTPAVKTELVKVINLNGLLNPVAVTLRRYAPIQSGLRFLVRVSRLLCLVVHSTSDTLRLVEKLFEACIQSLLAYEWQCGAFAMVLPESHTQTLLFSLTSLLLQLDFTSWMSFLLSYRQRQRPEGESKL